MQNNSIKNFSAEKLNHLYPISVSDYFNRTKTGALNLSTMKSIVDSHVETSKLIDGLHVIDWGCGNSLWALALFPNSKITGVDISEDNLRYSKMNAIENGVEYKFQGLLYDRDISLLNDANSFDYGMSFGLVELLDLKQFNIIYSKLFELLKPGARLFITHHNYRLLSAVYIPWIFRGGYDAYTKVIGTNISRKTTNEVILDFQKLGYILLDSGGYCPYPSKLWPFVISDKGYMTKNLFIKNWYYSQFIVLSKPLL